jgi:hypothetical protein
MHKILVLMAVISLGVAAAAAAQDRPALKVKRVAPLTVAGSTFRPTTRVAVTAGGSGSTQKRVARVQADGSFSVAFAFRYDPCSAPLVVVARTIGGNGPTARLKLPERMCPPTDKRP